MTHQTASPQPAPSHGVGIRDSKIAVPSYVVRRAFATEMVVLNLEKGIYYALNATAGRMLDLLDETSDFTETARRLAAEYDRSATGIEQDLSTLCEELLDRGLIELT